MVTANWAEQMICANLFNPIETTASDRIFSYFSSMQPDPSVNVKNISPEDLNN